MAQNSEQPVSRQQATLIGSTAVVMWATLALLTELAGDIPPFQMMAMAFTIAFALARTGMYWRGIESVRVPWAVWAFGIAGLFGYHAMYFVGLAYAPAANASLINYLWPLLIVVFSALLPKEKLAWYHLLGALLGFAGAVLLVARGGFDLSSYGRGYAAALASALIWSSYSVGTRYWGDIPTETMSEFCGVTAILAGLCHIFFEQTVVPQSSAWWAVLGIGLAPAGASFFTWNIGVKYGNIKLLGVLGYGAPLLSTFLLVVFGLAPATWRLLVACLLIVAGACVASLPMVRSLFSRTT